MESNAALEEWWGMFFDSEKKWGGVMAQLEAWAPLGDGVHLIVFIPNAQI